MWETFCRSEKKTWEVKKDICCINMGDNTLISSSTYFEFPFPSLHVTDRQITLPIIPIMIASWVWKTEAHSWGSPVWPYLWDPPVWCRDCKEASVSLCHSRPGPSPTWEQQCNYAEANTHNKGQNMLFGSAYLVMWGVYTSFLRPPELPTDSSGYYLTWLIF